MSLLLDPSPPSTELHIGFTGGFLGVIGGSQDCAALHGPVQVYLEFERICTKVKQVYVRLRKV